MKRMYICIGDNQYPEDQQKDGLAVGEIQSAQDWQKKVSEWTENESVRNAVNKLTDEQDIMKYIGDTFDLEFAPIEVVEVK